MDKIDYRLISLLQENARMPLKQLAERVFLSSPATAARLERLEKSGIKVYRTDLDGSIVLRSDGKEFTVIRPTE